MPPADHLLAFTVAAVVLIAVPGPSVLFVIGRALTFGRWGGVLSVVGNALGMLPQVIAVALGVGVVVAQSVLLFSVVKYLGVVYLIYLGVQAIRHRHQASATPDGVGAPTRATLLRQGFVVGATNPKSMVFFVAVLPQFVDAGAGAVPVQLAVLGVIFLLLALLFDSIWALAAGTARAWFAKSPKRLAGMAAGGGAMMIGLGGTLAFVDAKS